MPEAAVPRGRYEGRALGRLSLRTRAALLEAAAAHLESTPWRQASMAEIARMVGVSGATAYQYFSGVEDLALSVVADANARGEAVPEHLALVVGLLAFEGARIGVAP